MAAADNPSRPEFAVVPLTVNVDETEFDCGTLGRAPVDVCRERVVIAEFEAAADADDEVVADDIVLLLLLLPILKGGSKDVTVVEGAVGTLLLRKCLKENEEF